MTINTERVQEIKETNQAKRILLTGARSFYALELARLLKKSGHTVFASDTTTMHVTRFSNSIKKFYSFPSPRYDAKGFIDTLNRIIIEESIDMVIPIWEEVIYISLHQELLPESCEVFCAPFQLLHDLHHKWNFIKLLGSYGIKAPWSVLLKSNKDFENFEFKKPYILKKCFSRGSRFIFKVSSNKPPKISIQPNNPWIAQQYLEGDKYCSYSVCSKGHVLAHTAYAVNYTIDGSSCVAFEAIEHSGIFGWVKNLAHKTGFTGQIAFDFIVQDGEVYAIECNPRATSGIHLFKPEDKLDLAFLDNTEQTIMPTTGNSQQIGLGMLIYGLRMGSRERRFSQYLKKFLTTKDVIYSSSDLAPFCAEPLILISYWLRSKILGVTIPLLFTQDLEWDEDPNATNLSNEDSITTNLATEVPVQLT